MRLTAPLLALAASILSTAMAQDNTTCHNYVVISIRGTYEVQGRSIAFQSMINNTFAVVPDGIEYDAVYPAAPNQTAYLGADDVARYLNEGIKNCPSQRYAILGYSQGASATMLTLANITEPGTPLYEAIRAVIVVGNPYHVPNATRNIDENGGNSTRMYPGAAYNAGNPDSSGIAPIYYQNNKLLDICHTEDIVCAPGYPNSSFFPGHVHYGDQEVQDLGARYLIYHLSGCDSYFPPDMTNSTTTTSSALPTPTSVVVPSGTGTGSPTGTAAALAARSRVVRKVLAPEWKELQRRRIS